MFEPPENSWENNDEGSNYWEYKDSQEIGAGASISDLRDNALRLFEMYLAFRLNVQPCVSNTDIAARRRFLSEEETENILKDFGHTQELEPGVYGIGANSVEELVEKSRQLMNSLMERIMSNLMQAGVNAGLVDCAFDDEQNSFAFRPSEKGEKLIKKMRGKKKKKKKKNDTGD